MNLESFQPSKKWPFPRKHRLLQPSWETCAGTCFPLIGSKSCYQKIKRNSTNYCVAGRGNLRKLVLIGSYVAFKRHSSKQQGWGDERWSYLLWGRVLEQSASCLQMGSFAYEVSAPHLSPVATGMSYECNRAGKGSVPSPTFLHKREGIISPHFSGSTHFLAALFTREKELLIGDVRLLMIH